MGYVEELRSIIGHRQIILCGSGVIINDAEGRILMQKRVYPYGAWGLPGGLMELGETTEETARRELYEETGLVLGKLKLLGVYSGKNYFCRAANGDEYYVVMTVYTTDEYSGILVVDESESLSMEWIALNELLDMRVAGTHREVIRDYAEAVAGRVMN